MIEQYRRERRAFLCLDDTRTANAYLKGVTDNGDSV